MERDRLQSGVSLGTVVVETMGKGGTMHTVNFAKQQSCRIACYYFRLNKMSNGNMLIVNNGVGEPLENIEKYVEFLLS